jgi:UDP-N-acetyl-D-mannosaminuronic acid transferase (WecB/TagA/CpsF family)
MPIEAERAFPSRHFLDIAFAAADFDDVLGWCRNRSSEPGFAYVVTPNVDHVVRLFPKAPSALTADFRAAYAGAALRICDSRILAQLARLAGVELPVVTGSDLTAALFDRVFARGHRIALVGGQPDTCARLAERCPGIGPITASTFHHSVSRPIRQPWTRQPILLPVRKRTLFFSPSAHPKASCSRPGA